MDFEYTRRSVPAPEAPNLEDFDFDLAGCKCDGECRPSTSDEADGCSCLMYGKQNYDSEGRLLVDEGTDTPILECHGNCSCSTECGNRAVQFGLQLKVEPFICPQGKGIGLRALEPISRGRFVIEYSGQIVTAAEAKRRAHEYKSAERPHHFIFTLNEHTNGVCHQTFIDATKVGNLARFINHSCDPNLQPMIVRYGRSIPACALFAGREIQVGEEFGYDYGRLWTSADHDPAVIRKLCRCNAANCCGYLPTAEYLAETSKCNE